MAGKKVDWSILSGTVIGFVMCVLVAAGMLAASYYFKQNMEQQYRASHGVFRSVSQQYLAVDEEERIIEEFYPEFVRLYRAGLLGAEQRLSWLETLRGAGQAIKIPELNYKLDAQREMQVDYTLSLGGYSLYVSAMTLSLGLLHEGDLLQLLNILDRDARGQYTIRDCNFRRAATEFELDPQRANVRADCTLEWLTLDLSGDQELAL